MPERNENAVHSGTTWVKKGEGYVTIVWSRLVGGCAAPSLGPRPPASLYWIVLWLVPRTIDASFARQCPAFIPLGCRVALLWPSNNLRRLQLLMWNELQSNDITSNCYFPKTTYGYPYSLIRILFENERKSNSTQQLILLPLSPTMKIKNAQISEV